MQKSAPNLMFTMMMKNPESEINNFKIPFASVCVEIMWMETSWSIMSRNCDDRILRLPKKINATWNVPGNRQQLISLKSHKCGMNLNFAIFFCFSLLSCRPQKQNSQQIISTQKTQSRASQCREIRFFSHEPSIFSDKLRGLWKTN